MFLTHWLNKLIVPVAAPARPAGGFRPSVEALDDRIVPHASGFLFDTAAPFDAPWTQSGDASTGTAAPQATTQFRVLTRGQAFAGGETAVTVLALDASGRPVRDYVGTVKLTSTDAAATLPAAYTVTTTDRGRHTCKVTLATVGSGGLTATDTTTAAVTGTVSVNVVAAPVTTHLFVQAERDAYTGAVARVVVAALDASNRIVPTYTGTVKLTSTDAGATLPAATTFAAADKGVKVLTFTPSVAGSQTVTAIDTATATVVGTAAVTVTAAPVATHFAVITRHGATSGSPVQVYVVALDDNNAIARTYAGTVALTSSDAAATLPANLTFAATDRGVKAVSVTLPTVGVQTVTATDATTATLTGNTTVTVRSASSALAGVGDGGLFGGFHRRGRRG